MAEQIVNDFTVNRPIDEAWPIICDIERIAPCLPGAQLEEIEGDIYRGKVMVKLGVVATEFKGEAHLVERDDTRHHARMTAKGRDTKGRGNAAADIVADAEALSPTSTRCTVTADLHITGKVAQFGGRGILADVSKKLMNQFAANLNDMLDEDTVAGVEPVEASVPVAEEPVVEEQPTAAAPPRADQPTVRRIDGPAAEPVDVLDVAGVPILKRVAPLVAVLVVIGFLLRRRR